MEISNCWRIKPMETRVFLRDDCTLWLGGTVHLTVVADYGFERARCNAIRIMKGE